MKYKWVAVVLVLLAIFVCYLKCTNNISWIKRNGEYAKLLVIHPIPNYLNKEEVRVVFSRFEQTNKLSMKELMLRDIYGQEACELLIEIQMAYNNTDKNKAINDGELRGLQTFMAVEYDGKWGRSKFDSIRNSNYVRFFPDMNGSSYRLIDSREFPSWLKVLVSGEVAP